MKQLFSVFCFCFLSVCSYSQDIHLGLFGGVANYSGDLGSSPYNSKLTRPAFGVTAGYDITNRIMIRGGLTFAKIMGSDQFNKKDYLKLRNLSFASNITEFSVLGEFSTFDISVKKWSPYVFGGLAIFHFNPYTYTSNNQKVYLKPLSTEGEGLIGYPQRRPYSLTQLALPFGAGIKYAITDNIHIGLEIGFRKLFTDYLDDVSTNYVDETDLLTQRGQTAVDVAYRGDEVTGGNPNYPVKDAQRGSSNVKDWYYTTGLHLSFRLGNNGGGGGGTFGSHYRKGYGCPANPM